MQLLNDTILEAVHKMSSWHKAMLMEAKIYGCFYCLTITTLEQNPIKDWCDEGQTALCPRCGIDAIIPQHTTYLLTPDLLQAMNNYWF
ncbi:MAG: cytoplasmic protein [bacterium]